jgi:hypothetical protein
VPFRPFARGRRTLVDQLELFRCYYNFILPHSSLRLGREVRTPAMQAGLARRRYSFRDIFGPFIPGAPSSGRGVVATQYTTYERRDGRVATADE